MKDLAFATIQELSQALEDKKISVSELITYFTQRFAQNDDKLGSALEIFDGALISNQPEAGSG